MRSVVNNVTFNIFPES